MGDVELTSVKSVSRDKVPNPTKAEIESMPRRTPPSRGDKMTPDPSHIPLSTSMVEILKYLKKQSNYKSPPPPKEGARPANFKRCCDYHEAYGHGTGWGRGLTEGKRGVHVLLKRYV